MIKLLLIDFICGINSIDVIAVNDFPTLTTNRFLLIVLVNCRSSFVVLLIFGVFYRLFIFFVAIALNFNLFISISSQIIR